MKIREKVMRDMESETSDDEGQSGKDYTQLPLKPNHEDLPLWVLPNRRIFVETFAPKYNEAV